MKNILVATDFTLASRFATAYAAQIASAVGSRIHLLHVYQDPIPALAGPEMWSLDDEKIQAEYEAKIQQEIKASHIPVKITGQVVNGFKLNTLRDAADEMNADLVVLGRKKEGKKSIGSMAIGMIRKSNKPLLIVPESSNLRPAKHIVFAVDFTEFVHRVQLDPLIKIVRALNSSVTVIHVEQKATDPASAEFDEKLQMGVALGAISYVYEHIEADDVEAAILDFVERHPADLLVMFAHHHDIFTRLFELSHTQELSLQLKIPLLVLKTT